MTITPDELQRLSALTPAQLDAMAYHAEGHLHRDQLSDQDFKDFALMARGLALMMQTAAKVRREQGASVPARWAVNEFGELEWFYGNPADSNQPTPLAALAVALDAAARTHPHPGDALMSITPEELARLNAITPEQLERCAELLAYVDTDSADFGALALRGLALMMRRSKGSHPQNSPHWQVERAGALTTNTYLHQPTPLAALAVALDAAEDR